MSPTEDWNPNKPGRFGPAVIGEDEAKRQAEIRDRQKNVFGPRVFGDRVDDRTEEELLAEKLEGELDPAEENDEVTAAIEEAAGEDGYLSVKNLKVAVEEGPPATFDRLLDAELKRKPPRRTALRYLLEKEIQRDGGPRAAVQKVIETALTRGKQE